MLKVWADDKYKEIRLEFSKWEVRLPSEAEWEKAARGENGLRYPWGNEFVQENVNSNMIIGSTSAVGCFPGGHSPYGMLDTSGNVLEWCTTQWTDNYEDYGINENNELEGDTRRVLRGGAFYDNERDVRGACRNWDLPDDGDNFVGFRVVVVASPISPASGS